MPAAKKTTTESFDAFSAMSPDVLKEGYERFAKSFSTLADFQKNSAEAMMTSAGVYARGVEGAASEQTAFVKESYEDTVSAAKAVGSAKSVQEAMEIQSDYLRQATEKNLGFVTKVADHWTTVTKEASEPLSKRYGEFVEMIQTYRP